MDGGHGASAPLPTLRNWFTTDAAHSVRPRRLLGRLLLGQDRTSSRNDPIDANDLSTDI